MVSSALSVAAQERVQEFAWSYPAERFKELSILNRLGNVDIRQGGEQFEIQAEIRVKAKSLEKADAVMQHVRIEAVESLSMLNLSTILEKEFTIRRLFFGVSIEIDYHVKIPKGKKLSVANKNGSVLAGRFSGDLNIDIVSGDFKAQQVEGDFTAKLDDGLFEVQQVNRFSGEFRSAEVKLHAGKRVKVSGEGSNINVIKAEEAIAKVAGGSLYIGNVNQVELHAAGAKCEIQDVAKSLRADTRAGRLVVHSIHPFFSTVEVSSSSTKVALSFRPGGGFHINFKHDNIKIVLPNNLVLESKPTTKRKVFIESGFVGDKPFNSQVELNIMGGEIVIQ
jgi:hypothetical protein